MNYSCLFAGCSKLASVRLRRNISSQLLAERTGISRQTLSTIEKGSPSVAMGSYSAVLHGLNGLDGDLLLVAKDDAFGRKLQDLGLSNKKRIRSSFPAHIKKACNFFR